MNKQIMQYLEHINLIRDVLMFISIELDIYGYEFISSNSASVEEHVRGKLNDEPLLIYVLIVNITDMVNVERPYEIARDTKNKRTLMLHVHHNNIPTYKDIYTSNIIEAIKLELAIEVIHA